MSTHHDFGDDLNSEDTRSVFASIGATANADLPSTRPSPSSDSMPASRPARSNRTVRNSIVAVVGALVVGAGSFAIADAATHTGTSQVSSGVAGAGNAAGAPGSGAQSGVGGQSGTGTQSGSGASGQQGGTTGVQPNTGQQGAPGGTVAGGSNQAGSGQAGSAQAGAQAPGGQQGGVPRQLAASLAKSLGLSESKVTTALTAAMNQVGQPAVSGTGSQDSTMNQMDAKLAPLLAKSLGVDEAKVLSALTASHAAMSAGQGGAPTGTNG